MKKFLSVLLLVLCLALPAAAATEVISKDELLEAVASANSGDTIVVAASIDLGESGLEISSDKTLTLQISKDCVLSASGGGSDCRAIYNEGNLTITGDGKITTSAGEFCCAYGVYGKSGSTTIIKGNVEITVASSFMAYGVDATKSTVTIADSVEITATSGSDGKSYGVRVSGSDCVVKILNGTVSGDLVFDSGTITVYAGKFSGAMDVKCALGPDSTRTGAGTGTDPYIVINNATMTFNPTSLDIAQGSSGVVSVDLRVSGDVTLSSFDTLEVTPTVEGITVTPSSTDGTIKFDVADTCAPDTYTFSVFCQGKDSSDKTHLQTETFTVTVKEAEPTPEPGKSDVSNGGCNAGFAGLALAAFALLAAKRRK